MNYIYSNTLQFTLNSCLIQRRIVLISHNPTLLAVQALRCLLSFSKSTARLFSKSSYPLLGSRETQDSVVIPKGWAILLFCNRYHFSILLTQQSLEIYLRNVSIATSLFSSLHGVPQCRTSEVYSKGLWRMKSVSQWGYIKSSYYQNHLVKISK